MSSNKVPIPAEVIEGLEAVRLSGKTNMFDVSAVINLALDMGYAITATWIEENRWLYAWGILIGFEVTTSFEDGGGNQCAD